MKNIIESIFNNVKYWQDKNMLLKAIPNEYYCNKIVMLNLFNISINLVSKENRAKRDLWNYMVVEQKLGDDILNNICSEILDDKEFAKIAIHKYNRTYIYLSTQLQDSYELATLAASNEIYLENKYIAPIMMYMPQKFQNDIDISLIASARNIHNIQYAPILQTNRYFIIDIMNSLSSFEQKKKVLSYIDQSLLEDKIFVSKLGCFDNLCDRFKGDILYLSNAVIYDIKILNKTELFHEDIISSVIHSSYYANNLDESLSILFKYIKRFNDNYKELNEKIQNKELLNKILWDMGEVLLDEFIHI